MTENDLFGLVFISIFNTGTTVFKYVFIADYGPCVDKEALLIVYVPGDYQI
jgi:hypothetical protein